MNINNFFAAPKNLYHRQYEAMRAFLYKKKPANEVAKKYNYTQATIYSMARNFKQLLATKKLNDYLFAKTKLGRPEKLSTIQIKDKIVALRKHYLSVEDIKEKLDAQGETVSETLIYHTVKAAGFARLPKRSKLTKIDVHSNIKIGAPEAMLLADDCESFNSSNVDLMFFTSAYSLRNR